MGEDQVVKAAINHISRNCTPKQEPDLIDNKCHLENQQLWVRDSQRGIYQQLEWIVTNWN